MHLDAIDLKDFYTRKLGRMVRRLLKARIRARWSDLKGMRVFGLGYATPYLSEFRGEAYTLGALMPAGLGALPWPERGPSLTALVDEIELPLDDEAADRILLVVPNRRGLWARVDTTPFGYGSPFSRSQLTKLLKDAMFQPEGWHYALYMPPFNWRILTRWPSLWERLGLVLWPTFSGVILVEATKQVYAAMPVRESARAARRRIVPVPAGAVTTRLAR